MAKPSSHPKPGSIVSETFADTVGFVCAAAGSEVGGEQLLHCHPRQQQCPTGGRGVFLSQLSQST